MVKQIQARLNQLGYGPLAVDGLYGKVTILSVKAWQRQNFDQKGHPLTVDGKVGPLTWASLFPTPAITPEIPSPLLIQALVIARQEIGVTEVPPGSNSGPRVNEYLHSTNLGPGYAWCAAFVYFVFEQASAKLNRVNPLFKTASCLEHWKKTKGIRIDTAQALVNNKLIVPGSIFIIRFKYGMGHTGIVTDVHDDYIRTIEGNTNPNHSAEGLGVFELQRKIETITRGFIIYS
jgi:peptidoglycan hydrolase-like protein with peptidoglycan-binding domain